jgi:glycosyltransferase involved in cell wall biosynthesis
MRIAIVTDAWKPQVNGVVRTQECVIRELEQMGHEVHTVHPYLFRRVPCPGYPEIELALLPYRGISQRLQALRPDAIHIATEGPLGWAARKWCMKNKHPFTTAYHTKFPEIINGYTRLPLSWAYSVVRRFHSPSSAMLVPTPAVARELQSRGFTNAIAWTHGVDTNQFAPVSVDVLGTARPRWLFVGRASVEKNIEAFCKLELPGSKWIVGVGPILDRLKASYPEINFRGVLDQDELARTYASSDVFVFPSKADTFGLVMLEALACGTPVAAYPVPGPLDVIGESPAGALDHDLQRACERALSIPRPVARQYAEQFSWRASADLMLQHLAIIQR